MYGGAALSRLLVGTCLFATIIDDDLVQAVEIQTCKNIFERTEEAALA